MEIQIYIWSVQNSKNLKSNFSELRNFIISWDFSAGIINDEGEDLLQGNCFLTLRDKFNILEIY